MKHLEPSVLRGAARGRPQLPRLSLHGHVAWCPAPARCPAAPAHARRCVVAIDLRRLAAPAASANAWNSSKKAPPSQFVVHRPPWCSTFSRRGSLLHSQGRGSPPLLHPCSTPPHAHGSLPLGPRGRGARLPLDKGRACAWGGGGARCRPETNACRCFAPMPSPVVHVMDDGSGGGRRRCTNPTGVCHVVVTASRPRDDCAWRARATRTGPAACWPFSVSALPQSCHPRRTPSMHRRSEGSPTR